MNCVNQSTHKIKEDVMAVGQNSIKRAASGKPAAKATEKAAEKKAPAKQESKAVKAAVAASVSKSTQKLFIDQEDGVNAHYGVNTPLPTFLL